ncbi:MAG: hypothetical protein HYS27_02630 [Deltaproteobacteria bacterium]|nr:hypothetical protein [Deltaproteobacteria bacterium]
MSTRHLLVVTTVTIALSGCPAEEPPPAGPVWSPGVTHASDATPVRGFVDLRGLVHSHSVYSHDACDGAPVLEDGTRDPVCFDDFRRGLCQAKHDFAFLTDHRESFTDTEYPEALLFRPERGDVLIEHDGVGTANRAACDDGSSAIIMGGAESDMMPVGLEHHVPGDRGSVYGSRTPEAAQAEHDAGAVVLLAHPEDFSVAELLSFPLDGFEMFNLHANTFLGMGIALDFILRWQDGDTGLPHPDLLVFGIYSEDPRYLQRWGNVLATGRHLVTTMGTDCHRNTFAAILEDGERGDSYRRMMVAFSNHVRARPLADGTLDDRAVKEALAAGRNYGVFEMLGTPVGFDVHADKSGTSYELGDTVPVGSTLVVDAPRVRDLDPAAEAPTIRLRVLRATDDEAGFVEVASTTDARLSVPLDVAGAYRAEVRMLPWHLREHLRDDAYGYLEAAAEDGRDYVWIYGGALYVE